jgi:hypothetical protein
MEVILNVEMVLQVIQVSQHNEEQRAGLVVEQMDEPLLQLVVLQEQLHQNSNKSVLQKDKLSIPMDLEMK